MNLAAGPGTSSGTGIAGALAVAAGIALLIGILTPLSAGLVGILTIGMWSSWLPMSQSNAFDSTLSLPFVAAVAASLTFLGPGAFSLDARLFGWREIIIPARHSPEISEQAPE